MAKKAKKSKKPREMSDRQFYNRVVFQHAGIAYIEQDLGIMEIATKSEAFRVILNHTNAEHLIEILEDFIEGRAPHYAQDRN